MSRIENAMEKAARLREGKEKEKEEGERTVPPLEATSPEPAAQHHRLLPKNPCLINLRDPFSDIAEEYRKLKLALVQLAKGEEGFRSSVLVTSSVPSEGKSLTALNLAISLAQELDHTALLVDSDLRKPSLHRYLELEQGVGFSDLLLGKAQLKEAVIETGIGNLAVIRAGSRIDNPAELCSSARVKTLLQQLKHAYPERFLIFDSPPVLPFAETRSLASLVDGVLFVVRERQASQANVHEALESLKQSRIIGTVYNAALLARHDERYSHYHGYYRNRERKGIDQPAETPQPEQQPSAT